VVGETNECKNCKKLESKLKMMEISFELINKSRNDLIKQLAEQELLNEKLLCEKHFKQKEYKGDGNSG